MQPKTLLRRITWFGLAFVTFPVWGLMVALIALYALYALVILLLFFAHIKSLLLNGVF